MKIVLSAIVAAATVLLVQAGNDVERAEVQSNEWDVSLSHLGLHTAQSKISSPLVIKIVRCGCWRTDSLGIPRPSL